ncbi:MAG: DEAD/DEAH box helicase [Acidobacteria bacterium]|nr:MAG: DEAD/DEAH box helicase [Acidobacteriota bacterium]
MNVFELRDRLVGDYASYIRSFIRIRDPRIDRLVQAELDRGLLWPEPLIQLNPAFEPGASIEELVAEGLLHRECGKIFRQQKTETDPGKPLRLYRHQEEALRAAKQGGSYVLTTGTGSGKSLAYIVPIVDHVLRRGSGKGIQAIVVYPMNALANSQLGELEKFLCLGYPEGRPPVTFARYTGQDDLERREEISRRPPDVLLTNYVMLELIMTRPYEKRLIDAAQGLRFLVFDELHTYRGRQGADVAMLIRRVRDLLAGDDLQCVGTSATLAGGGTWDERRDEVATLSSTIFGTGISADAVIGETLKRATRDFDFARDAAARAALVQRLEGTADAGEGYEALREDPLAAWIESTFGLRQEEGSGRLVRSAPRAVGGDGASARLSELTGVDPERCAEAIRRTLLSGYRTEHPETGLPAFAFRLHQFMSRGDTVHASLEPAAGRHVTVFPQKYVPGDRERVLLPLVFCRECGQEYYCVRVTHVAGGARHFAPRELSDQLSDDASEAGFLYWSAENPWPSAADAELDRLPDDWIEQHRGIERVRRARRDWLPRAVRVGTDGREADGGLDCHYVKAPFRFCLNCGIAYYWRLRSDFGKLTSLATEGRSTATTILVLSAMRRLRAEGFLGQRARKLLSFTDNRQDASLQAGHFNDFVEISILRGALYGALEAAGDRGLEHDELTQKVFAALDLPRELYASDPEVKFQGRKDTDRAFRDVIGYRLYRDQQRGWRITSPNLEQCGLVEVGYQSLDELCEDVEIWQGCHEALLTASPETRQTIARTLLDFMRRELALKVDYLDPLYQERLIQRSFQRLREPWAIDENESLERSVRLFPRQREGKSDDRRDVFLGPRSGFNQYLRRTNVFPDHPATLGTGDAVTITRQLLAALREAGIVEAVEPSRDAVEDDPPGYQLNAGSLTWRLGAGTETFHDPIRVPRAPASGSPPNRFFVDFYRTAALAARGLEAREHTAQVPPEEREKREARFRDAELPVLFCSPTMELGVDIAELSVVNLRNVPPTPANYAQRSGRAGRSGQPALVFTYCTSGSPHDQYFFKRPERMVAGAVAAPRLELANEDLIRSHLHAIWLRETGQGLGDTLKDVLDLSGEPPALELLPEIARALDDVEARRSALRRAERVLDALRAELEACDWYRPSWIDGVFQQLKQSFLAACERWKNLYRSAYLQSQEQHRICLDASRSTSEKEAARQLRRQAEAQLALLTEPARAAQSDFYSYRYFASEGFLPGYNFPRLPVSAFIPGRPRRKGEEEYLSRPRFLAISEFGPRSYVYHEGSRYQITKVILPVTDEDALTSAAKLCHRCGYLHPVTGGAGPDLCELCGAKLPPAQQRLFRLQNVATRRRDRISSDEEERRRLGFELVTRLRFAARDDAPSARRGRVLAGEDELARLTYADAATLWRINLGWRRRQRREEVGFVLDLERGIWGSNRQLADEDPEDPMSARLARVVPYVEDHRNCLLWQPSERLPRAQLLSLRAALKHAVQLRFQLEDSELAAEPLPDAGDPALLLFYEAAEGGAGALRRLLDDAGTVAEVARAALDLCHFDPATGEDRDRAPGARERCEAACYDCLMSYANQPDHECLDRHPLRDLLLQLSAARVETAPVEAERAEHLARLLELAGSQLERRWLRFLDAHGLRLPHDAQTWIEACGARPDFLYRGDHRVAIYVDGPVHDHPRRHQRDRDQRERLEDLGYVVLRFHHQDDWAAIVERYPYVFGSGDE